MKFKKLLSFAMFALIFSNILLLAGCGKELVAPTNLELSRDEIYLGEKETYTLLAEVYPLNATNRDIRWESSNDDVASVAKGVVHGKAVGSCVIYATTKDENHTYSCMVTVGDNFLRVTKDETKLGNRTFGTISEALAAAKKKDVILIEEGVYDEMVHITKPVTLKGQGATLTNVLIIGHPYPKEKSDELENVFVDSINFEINGTFEGYKTGILVSPKTDEIEITSCTFQGDNDSFGITTLPTSQREGNEELHITSSTFKNLKWGVNLNPYATEARVLKSNFENCQFAVSLKGTQRCDVEDNIVKNSGFLNFESAETLANHIVTKNNQISSFPSSPIIVCSEGRVKSGYVLDLKDNIFDGKSPRDMTKQQLDNLLSHIDGCEKDGKITNIQLMTTKEYRKVMGG